ncbi:hypothetical protein DK389_30255 [Methylobacterium durans]|uniref:Uncharacterized protein n=1 Tax=Methylobacterium durans TaxID=2202825 RepID=A0A2U8WHZ0_9HYPH|nr:hypothetical protein DK389_30255 [Methylobacterium durans]
MSFPALTSPLTLHCLAAGSYDLVLDGEIVASVVRDISAGGDLRGWRTEPLKDTLPFPAPFTKPVHASRTLEAAAAWLDGAEIAGDG